MTDTPPPPVQKPQSNNFFLEFGPVLAFFIVYMWLRRTLDDPNMAIYPAALVLAVSSCVALAWSWFKHKKVSNVLILTTVLVCGFAGLAYLFKDPRFLYVKPTITNTFFGVAVIAGVFLRKNVLKLLMGEAFLLPDKAWNTLAIRWGLFFFAMAALNELIWRTQTEEFWVSFKLLGFFPLTIAFTMSQIPFILKHGKVSGQGDAG